MTRRIYENVLGTIGQTPLVRLNKLGKETKATILAKLESRKKNTAGSIWR